MSTMRIKKRLILTILSVIILAFNIEAQKNEANLSDCQNEITGWLKEYHVPALGIGIIKDGKLEDYGVFGEQRKGITTNDSTIFTIASITKTITTMVTLKLIDSGQLDLDEPLYKYWIDPDLADDIRYKKISPRLVLSHRTGLPNWRNDLESKRLKFLFDPGEKYFYSGEGFEYLKKALERKLQKSLEQLADSILFKPLGMRDTKFRWDNESEKSRFAYRHDAEGKEYEYQGCTKTSAASGLLTTIEDFSTFGIYVMNKGGLSDSLYNEMITTQVNIKKNFDQGLGWQIVRNLPNDEYALFHEGGEWGVVTLVVLLPESKQGIILFTNGDNGDAIIEKIMGEFLEAGDTVMGTFKSRTFDPDKIKTVNISDDVLSAYTGTYFIKSFQMYVQLIIEDRQLKLVSPYSTMTLYAESEKKFFLKDDDLKIEFVTDENKDISGMMVIYKGGEPEFAKKIK